MSEHTPSEPERRAGTKALEELVRVLVHQHEVNLDFQAKQYQLQRAQQRWSNIRWLLLILAPIALALIYAWGLNSVIGLPETTEGDYAALVKIEGMIAPDEPASADRLVPAIHKAFQDKQAKGVVLLINSPGGTPAQASILYKHILRQREKHPDTPVMVVAEDYLTSGAYYVAAAAESIFIDDNTLAGSIGVKIEGFDASRLIGNLGVSRRLFTAGEHKARLDTFMPMRPEDARKIDDVLETMHAQFIEAVERGRGKRLQGEPETLYSGDFWVGREAVALGLADGVASLSEILNEKFDVSLVKDYTPRENWINRLSKGITTALTTWAGAPPRLDAPVGITMTPWMLP
ncbi:MAG TPA: S49 family peptidase [Thiohalobacter sp.]|nr:S49 family peptidase [Thiohalobacter sp.]